MQFYIFLQYEFFSFCFVLFFYYYFCFVLVFVFFPLCVHTYIYEFSCWVSFKAHRLVNKHDTKDSNELKEDHNINYSVGFGVWAQFWDIFFIHRKLINFDCSIAYSFCFFLDTCWRENLWAPIQLVNRIICLVNFLFFIWKFLFIYLSIVNVLCMGLDFVSYSVYKKLAWIREFLLKFKNLNMKN